APTVTSGADSDIDVAALGKLLLGRWADVRLEARRISVDPLVQRVPGESLRDHRDRVVKALHLLVDLGVTGRAFPKRMGGSEDPGANISGFEELVLGDPSVAIKGGVQ